MNRQISGNFGHGGDNAVYQPCHDDISRKNKGRASFGKHRTTADEETGMSWLAREVDSCIDWYQPSSDGSAQGDHLRMPTFQTSLSSCIAFIE